MTGIGLPAKCTVCGFVWETRNLIGGNGRTESRGNTTRCPKCGGIARIADGVFDMDGSDAQLVSGPPLTRDLFAELLAAIEQSKGRGDTPEQTLQRVIAQAPERFAWLASPRVMGAFAAVGAAAGVLSALAAIAQVIVALRATPSEEEIARIARRVVAEQIADAKEPVVPHQLPHARPKQHGSDGAHGTEEGQDEPRKDHRSKKKRPKRKP